MVVFLCSVCQLTKVCYAILILLFIVCYLVRSFTIYITIPQDLKEKRKLHKSDSKEEEDMSDLDSSW